MYKPFLNDSGSTEKSNLPCFCKGCASLVERPSSSCS